MATQWNGTKAEQHELLAALHRWCTCDTDPAPPGISHCCPGHQALVTDQKFLDHLVFARTLRLQLQAEEFGGNRCR
jgi:hypothetical protein